MIITLEEPARKEKSYPYLSELDHTIFLVLSKYQAIALQIFANAKGKYKIGEIYTVNEWVGVPLDSKCKVVLQND